MFPSTLFFLGSIIVAHHALSVNAAALDDAVDVSNGTITNTTEAAVAATDAQVLVVPFPGLKGTGAEDGPAPLANVTDDLSRRDGQGDMKMWYSHSEMDVSGGFNLTAGLIAHDELELVVQDMISNVSQQQEEPVKTYIRLDARGWTLVLTAEIADLVPGSTVNPPPSFDMFQVLHILRVFLSDLRVRLNSRRAYCGKITNAQQQVLAIVGMARSFGEVSSEPLPPNDDAVAADDPSDSGQSASGAARRPLMDASTGHFLRRGTMAIAGTTLALAYQEMPDSPLPYQDMIAATFEGVRSATLARVQQTPLVYVAAGAGFVEVAVSFASNVARDEVILALESISQLVTLLLASRLPRGWQHVPFERIPREVCQAVIMSAVEGTIFRRATAVGQWVLKYNLDRRGVPNVVGYHTEL